MRKKLALLHGEIKSPPFSHAARQEAGFYLSKLQEGDSLSLPHSRPMPRIGSHCHELRIPDENQTWRIIYRIDPTRIVILEIFSKKTATTPLQVITACKRRLANYDRRN